MIEILPIAGMIFSLLLALIIGGFVLVFPLTRRLGKLLEIRLEERRLGAPGAVPPAQIDALREVVEGLRRDVTVLSERQQFVEELLERAEPDALPAPLDPAGGGAGH